jgi:hypothetical protein
MATTPATDNSKTKTPSKKSAALPEERFWKRYSPHHEFALSSTGSSFIHAIAFTILFFGSLIAARLGFNFDNKVEVDAMVIAGGGGSPGGAEGPNTGIGKQQEVAELNKEKPEREKPVESTKTDLDIVKPSTPDVMPSDEPAARLIEDDVGIGKRLDAKSQAIRDQIARLQQGNASRGQGGIGEGGGKGKGKGPGVGDASGPGRINVTKREKRQLRWTMEFNTQDGADYVRQLQALKAILAVPGPNGEYLVIEDLMTRPVRPTARDIREINRIYWVDDKRASVQSLSGALGLHPPPDHIVAFFPEELEQDLLKKELRARHLPEEKIGETVFKVRPSRGGYEPVVYSQLTIAELNARLKGGRR